MMKIIYPAPVVVGMRDKKNLYRAYCLEADTAVGSEFRQNLKSAGFEPFGSGFSNPPYQSVLGKFEHFVLVTGA
jgi:hypothetical protein